MGESRGVIAGRDRGDSLRDRKRHAARDRMSLLAESAQAVAEFVQRRVVAAGCVGERRMHLAEHEAGARDTPGQIGEPPPRLGLGGLAGEPEPPQERRAVDHRQPRVDGAHDVAVKDLERARVAAPLQLEHRLVPGEVAVE